MASGWDRCSSCGADIQWVLYDGHDPLPSSKMPLDGEPRADGNLILTFKEANTWHCRTATSEDPPERRRVSHFATCPDAGKWRGKRRKKK